MARVFTTTFPYKDSTYTAIVTQVDGSIYIRVTDPALQEILPLAQLKYQHDKGMEVEAQGLAESQDLVVAVLAAIEDKIQLSPNTPIPLPQESL